MSRILTRALLIAFSTLLLAETGLLQANEGASKEILQPGESTATAELPFKLVDGYLIVVEGRIGGHEHRKLALDTGATFSVLRTSLAKPEFARRTARVVNLDQVLSLEAVDVPDFSLGSISISPLPMMLNNLEYLGTDGSPVDAVIGLDVLRLKDLTIDFARKRILFGQARALRFNVPLETSETYVSAEVRTQERPLRLLLDSGVRSILLYRDRVGDRMPNLQVVRTIPANSLGGPASLDLVTLPSVQLGQRPLDRNAVMTDKAPAGFLAGIDGYLSLNSLGAHVCSISWGQAILSWE